MTSKTMSTCTRNRVITIDLQRHARARTHSNHDAHSRAAAAARRHLAGLGLHHIARRLSPTRANRQLTSGRPHAARCARTGVTIVGGCGVIAVGGYTRTYAISATTHTRTLYAYRWRDSRRLRRGLRRGLRRRVVVARLAQLAPDALRVLPEAGETVPAHRRAVETGIAHTLGSVVAAVRRRCHRRTV
jgi:hypothetical protein